MTFQLRLALLSIGALLLASCSNSEPYEEPKTLVDVFADGEKIGYTYSNATYSISVLTDADIDELIAANEAYRLLVETHRKAQQDFEAGEISRSDYTAFQQENRLTAPRQQLATVTEVGRDFLRVRNSTKDYDLVIPTNRIISVRIPTR